MWSKVFVVGLLVVFSINLEGGQAPSPANCASNYSLVIESKRLSNDWTEESSLIQVRSNDLWGKDGLVASEEFSKVIALVEGDNSHYSTPEAVTTKFIEPLRKHLSEKGDLRSRKFLKLIDELQKHPDELMAALKATVMQRENLKKGKELTFEESEKLGQAKFGATAFSIMNVALGAWIGQTYFGFHDFVMPLSMKITQAFAGLLSTSIVVGGMRTIHKLKPKTNGLALNIEELKANPSWGALSDKMEGSFKEQLDFSKKETIVWFSLPAKKPQRREMVLLKQLEGEDSWLLVPRSQLLHRFRNMVNIYRIPSEFLVESEAGHEQFQVAPEDYSKSLPDRFKYQEMLLEPREVDETNPEAWKMTKLAEIITKLQSVPSRVAEPHVESPEVQRRVDRLGTILKGLVEKP